MDEDEITGRAKGGVARAAALTPERRSEIARKAVASRWDKAKDIPQAEYSGKLKIGDMVFPCSVLSDGTRILTQSDFMSGMGMYYSGWVSKNRTEQDVAADVPHFLSFRGLKPFVDKHLGDLQSITVAFRTEGGGIARGIKAEIIPKICDVWLDAEERGKIGSRQKQVAQKAKLLTRALAHVGIVALVDEATGYQQVRSRDELRRLLEAYISPEFLPWTKRFPNEFYRELFRLRGWTYDPLSVKRPKLVGYLTENIVYKRLPEGVLDELKKLNPKDESGRRKRRHHQFLTDDIGNPHLEKHVASAITLMKISSSYKGFKKHLDKALPVPKSQLLLPFEDENGDEDDEAAD
jgi:hypothetical protein